jgi:hypothetical protein
MTKAKTEWKFQKDFVVAPREQGFSLNGNEAKIAVEQKKSSKGWEESEKQGRSGKEHKLKKIINIDYLRRRDFKTYFGNGRKLK